jgi:hypothetical protein
MAHCVISLLRSNLVASGVKRTSITAPDFEEVLFKDYSRAVPHIWRSRYLESQLMPPTPIDDESVRAAINRMPTSGGEPSPWKRVSLVQARAVGYHYRGRVGISGNE